MKEQMGLCVEGYGEGQYEEGLERMLACWSDWSSLKQTPQLFYERERVRWERKSY